GACRAADRPADRRGRALHHRRRGDGPPRPAPAGGGPADQRSPGACVDVFGPGPGDGRGGGRTVRRPRPQADPLERAVRGGRGRTVGGRLPRAAPGGDPAGGSPLPPRPLGGGRGAHRTGGRRGGDRREPSRVEEPPGDRVGRMTVDRAPADRAPEVRRMFDGIARRYDLLNRTLTVGMDVGWRRRTVRSLELPEGSLVLDLACGTGDLCRALRAAGLRAAGFDFSLGMLSAARTRSP